MHDCGDMGKLEHQARCQGATRRLGPGSATSSRCSWDASSACDRSTRPRRRSLAVHGNVKTAAVVRCECIEDDVNHVCYADRMLDRINLLSGGIIGVPWATFEAQPKGLGLVARSAPVPPKSMAGGERFRVAHIR